MAKPLPYLYVTFCKQRLTVHMDQASPRVSVLATSTVFGSDPATEYWLTLRLTFSQSEYEYLPNLTERVSRVHTLEILGCRYLCLFSARERVYFVAGITIRIV